MINTSKKPIMALLLVAIVLVATGAGVAATVTKAEAQTPTPYVIPIDGRPHVFSKMNLQQAVPPATASCNTVSIDFTSGEGGGFFYFGAVGIACQVNPGSYTPEQLAQIPATVTVKGTWTATVTTEDEEGTVAFEVAMGPSSSNLQASLAELQGPGTVTATRAFSSTTGVELNSGTPLTAANLLPDNPSELLVAFFVLPKTSGPATVHATMQVQSIAITLWPPDTIPTQLSMTSNLPKDSNGNATAVVNQKFTLNGTLQTTQTPPAKVANKPVYLEASYYGVDWVPISANAYTKADGSYRFTGYISAPGTYFIRAHFNGQYPYGESPSPTLTVKVLLPG